MNTQTHDPNEIIDRLGGTAKTAALCEVSAQAVHQWRVDGIPRARLMFLRVARPEVFEPASDGADETAKAA